MRVISLTSIPPRFATIGPVLESLCAQGADQVRLYLPNHYKRFPGWTGELPKLPSGVLLCWTETDFGPATKVLPACRDLYGKDAQILFCDDDCIVRAGWANRLFEVQRRRSNQAVASYVRSTYLPQSNAPSLLRARQLPVEFDVPYRVSRLANKFFGTQPLWRRPFVVPGFGEVLFGSGGAVVRPEFFDSSDFNIPDIAWPVDDIWLSAALARKGIKIFCPWLGALPRSHAGADKDALERSVFQGKSRQQLNRSASEYCRQVLGIWE